MADATIHDVWKERGNKSPALPSYDKWKADQTPANMHALVKEIEPTIDSAISAYVGNKASPTVKHRARVLAAKAIRSYDPQRGSSLQTHVNRQLQALQRMAPSLTDPFPAPEKFRQHSQLISNAASSLTDLLGREPTDEEIADEIHLPIKRVIKLRQAQRARVPLSSLETDDDDDTRPETVASSREPFDDWVDAVYQDLGDQDRLIMAHRTGYRGYPLLQNMDIAQKLRVSPAYVSQRARWIQSRLDEFDG